MKRKFVSFFLAMVMAVSCTVPAMAADVTADEVDSNESATLIAEPNEFAEGEAAPASVIQYLWKAAFMAAKWAVVKADNTLFNRDPQIINPGGNWVASSSGDVSFGNGDDDARRVKFTTTVSNSHNHLDVFAQTGITGWLDTITIFMEDSSGDEVYGGQVTHNQHIFTSYDLPLDTYTTYYVYSDNRDWDCWIYRYDFSADYARSAVSSDTPSYASNMVYNPETQKSYIIPSDTAVPSSRSAISDNTLTAQDLVDEFYDDQQDCSVNRLKSFDVDDTIFVTDVVTDLKYDESTNTTKLYFGNTTDGSFSWPFAGDLRSQINVNDELTFEFSVVEEYATDEYSFETLDYFLESYDLIAEGTAANIQDYLVG